MTLSSQKTKVVYDPDGLATVFAVPFPVYDAADIECVLVSETGENSYSYGFTVAGIEHGNVTVSFASPPPATHTLVIRRNTRRVQESDYPVAGRFPAKTLEHDLDRITAMIQELDEYVDRSIKVDAAQENAPDSWEFLQEFQDRVAQAQAALAAAQACRDQACQCKTDACDCATSAAASEANAQASETAADSHADRAEAAADAAEGFAQAAAMGTIPAASASARGGIRVGAGLEISDTDKLNVSVPLPPVTSADDDKVLTVIDGEWGVAEAKGGDLSQIELDVAALLQEVLALKAQVAADAGMQVKAWGLLDASGTVLNSHNIASVTPFNAYTRTITLTNAAPDADYVVICNLQRIDAYTTVAQLTTETHAKTTTQFTITCATSSGIGQSAPLHFAVLW